MDHQKLNILLIFGTFSFGGCGGQGCYFWPNPRVISKKSAIQDSKTTFKPKLACIFLPARAQWIIQVCIGTPCSETFFFWPNVPFYFWIIFENISQCVSRSRTQYVCRHSNSVKVRLSLYVSNSKSQEISEEFFFSSKNLQNLFPISALAPKKWSNI